VGADTVRRGKIMSPVYEFSCKTCGRFEAARKYEEIKEVRCPACRGEVRRVYSPVNFTFGWRLTPESNIRGAKDQIERNI